MATCKHECPEHGELLTPITTQFGNLLICPVDGCDVQCWDRPTSTPADAETRAARRRCHQVFDQLWKGPNAQMSRAGAYRLLAQILGKPQEQAHIGMATLDECERIEKAVLNEQR